MNTSLYRNLFIKYRASVSLILFPQSEIRLSVCMNQQFKFRIRKRNILSTLCSNASARKRDPSSVIRLDRRSNVQSVCTQIKKYLLQKGKT